jgi:hypothetical protein
MVQYAPQALLADPNSMFSHDSGSQKKSSLGSLGSGIVGEGGMGLTLYLYWIGGGTTNFFFFYLY